MINRHTKLSTLQNILVNKCQAISTYLGQTLGARRCPVCHAKTRSRLGCCPGCWLDLPWNANHCQICAIPITSESPICGGCLTRPPSFDRCVSPILYQFPVRQLVTEWKFKGKRHLTYPLSSLLIEHLRKDQLEKPRPSPSVLVPVPMHLNKRKHRLFDHTELLSKQISKALNIPINNKLVKKVRETPPQSSLNKVDRLNNLRGSFVASELANLKRVAVIDDVLTTGATAELLAKLLKQAGAEFVEIWCIARTP